MSFVRYTILYKILKKIKIDISFKLTLYLLYTSYILENNKKTIIMNRKI